MKLSGLKLKRLANQLRLGVEVMTGEGMLVGSLAAVN